MNVITIAIQDIAYRNMFGTTMAIDKSYLMDQNYTAIKSRLNEMLELTKGNVGYSVNTQAKMSLEILESLTTDHYPVSDVAAFRRAMIVTFFEKINLDIDIFQPIDVALAYAERYIALRLEALASEYHARLWRCLKIAISALSSLVKITSSAVDPVCIPANFS